MRLDVFRAKQAAERNIEKSGKNLSPEEKRLVEKSVQEGTRAGLALPDDKREQLTKLKKELSQTCLEFSVSVLDHLMITLMTIINACFRRKTSMKRRFVPPSEYWNIE